MEYDVITIFLGGNVHNFAGKYMHLCHPSRMCLLIEIYLRCMGDIVKIIVGTITTILSTMILNNIF